jgi:hypothetical protein
LIVAGLVAAITVSLSSDASAVDKNYFGQSAKQLAQSDDGMGDHSREGGAAGDAPFDNNPVTGEDDKPGRSGIGNVGEDLLGSDEKLHPSEVADCLDADGC